MEKFISASIKSAMTDFAQECLICGKPFSRESAWYTETGIQMHFCCFTEHVITMPNILDDFVHTCLTENHHTIRRILESEEQLDVGEALRLFGSYMHTLHLDPHMVKRAEESLYGSSRSSAIRKRSKKTERSSRRNDRLRTNLTNSFTSGRTTRFNEERREYVFAKLIQLQKLNLKKLAKLQEVQNRLNGFLN